MEEASRRVWEKLWPLEKRTQVRAAAFHGMHPCGWAAEAHGGLASGPKRGRGSKRARPLGTQASFHVFGMELLATLDLAATNDFFNTFFRLPDYYWRGFLASQLSAGQLIAFALVVFTLAPFSIKYKLIEHLITGKMRSEAPAQLCTCSVLGLCYIPLKKR